MTLIVKPVTPPSALTGQTNGKLASLTADQP